MARVTGIGGVFFKVKDPEKTRNWYKEHLGFNTDEYGSNFEWRQATPGPKKVSPSGLHSSPTVTTSMGTL